MDKILSQEEIDALMSGVVSGEVDTTPKEEEDPSGVKSYSLTNQERIIRGRMPTMEMINDRFTRQQSVSWSSLLHEKVEFSVVGTQIMKFGDFIKKVPLPSSFNVFMMEPLRGNGLYVMDASLVYLIVDFFFGGRAQTHVKPEGREFTTIQVRLIKKVVKQALADLEKAWQAVMQVKIGYTRTESNPQFAMVVTATEIVVVVTLQVVVGEASRDMFIAYPYSMLEPIKEKLYSGLFADNVEQDSSWGSRFKESLQDCPVTMTVQLGTARINVQDLLNFTPGDVLMLDQHPGDPLLCLVEGDAKFHGQPGVFKGNHACRVTKVLS
ncbi:MAG: flagellar motor switch protein FliM [Nitrospiraceae bacterium]|nr:flagellar motor switch protein FliM [Nitrospiraceae bacterium]